MPWSICLPRCLPSIDSVKIKDIASTNIQTNDLTQINDQLGRATVRWGTAKVDNINDQLAKNNQVGSAVNNIKVDTGAWRDLVTIKGVDATNMQGNTTVQANTQKGYSFSLGWDPVYNGSWQTAVNNQTGSANNNINVWT